MGEIYVPNCQSFQNENTFLGSYRGIRFKLTPQLEDSTIQAELWRGKLCYELSQMEKTETFPLTPEGVEAMTAWLEHEAEA